ncbi:efflux RND transporter periplasmic adaptor subunit [Tautonia plasticadhaerens]|uniref:Efflux pump periplasmic linker BepF n=1 Tax=Tautonia plasticadhaerens TaxID=2527974 RepID=A0A518H1H8_9BACT|nr:efflux RND transporter periplasmic adaptor subunit [Tautonia plasticadhaerens]QDV34690.1 Efflux pump periplasmic linker BepF [Tautonia plasticadhaerens]
MNPFAYARRRPITTLLLVLGLATAGVLAATMMDVVDVPAIDTARIGPWLDRVSSRALDSVSGVAEAAEPEEQGHHGEHHTIIVTRPKAMDVTITQPYVCQIHSRRHIDVCALESGYLEQILVGEGQVVKEGDLMFKILPTLYQARLDAEMAEAQLAELEYNNTKSLADKKVVSQNEVKLLQAKLSKAQAMVTLAKAELNFTNVVAPFDGIVDRLHQQLGSLIGEGDVLTTLSDNSVMWVYFNVPEAAYLEYMDSRAKDGRDERIELELANGELFSQVGKIGAIEAKFNNETGNIPFRADFPNPDRLLRHGQTGTVLINRVLEGAIVIPQRATFEILDKRYVYVVDDDDHVVDDEGDDDDDEGNEDDGAVHQRLITIEHEKDDIFTVKSGLTETDKIVLEGIREVREGEEIEYEFQEPEEVLGHQKYHAE